MRHTLFDNPVRNTRHPANMDDPQSFMRIYKFDNGYGASVVRFRIPGTDRYGSYTRDTEYELAVIRFHNPEETNPKKLRWAIDFSTKLTSEVMGYLNKDKVEKSLAKIKKLPIPAEAIL